MDGSGMLNIEYCFKIIPLHRLKSAIYKPIYLFLILMENERRFFKELAANFGILLPYNEILIELLW